MGVLVLFLKHDVVTRLLKLQVVFHGVASLVMTIGIDREWGGRPRVADCEVASEGVR